MNFIADEGVDRIIVEHLRKRGFAVRYIAEMCPGSTDEKVLCLANASAEILLTCDKDFGELVFRQRRLTHGIVLLRLAGLPGERKAELTIAVVQMCADRLANSFAVIAPHQTRLRPLHLTTTT